MKFRRLAAVVGLWLTIAGAAMAQTPARQGVDLQITHSPAVVEVGGSRQLVSELHITNFASEALTLDALTVLDGAGAVLAALSDTDLQSLVGGTPRADAAGLAPGQRVVVYFNLPLAEAATPAAIIHRLTLSGPGGKAFTVDGARADIAAVPTADLGPPLRGANWAAVYDPAMTRGHRRVVYATEGRAVIPGRFAIDWFKVDDQGRFAAGTPERLDDFYGYGAEVLAVADAAVAAVRDGVAEAPRLADTPRAALGDATGNFIALRLPDGRHVFYEHLQPGLTVKVGDTVRRGQVIGRLGLTGEGLWPHLHFHVADGASPLGSEGAAYRLDGFTPVGAYSSIDAFGRGEAFAPTPAPRAPGRGLPGPNMVVAFPE